MQPRFSWKQVTLSTVSAPINCQRTGNCFAILSICILSNATGRMCIKQLMYCDFHWEYVLYWHDWGNHLVYRFIFIGTVYEYYQRALICTYILISNRIEIANERITLPYGFCWSSLPRKVHLHILFIAHVSRLSMSI